MEHKYSLKWSSIPIILSTHPGSARALPDVAGDPVGEGPTILFHRSLFSSILTRVSRDVYPDIVNQKVSHFAVSYKHSRCC